MKNMTIISLVVTIVLALAVTKFVFAEDAAVPVVAEVQAEQPAMQEEVNTEVTPAEPTDQDFADLLNELEEDGN